VHSFSEELKNFVQSLELAAELASSVLEVISKYIDMEKLREEDPHRILKVIMNLILRVGGITLSDLKLYKEVTLDKYGKEELLGELVEIKKVKDISTNTILYLEAEIEFKGKRIEAVFLIYVDANYKLQPIKIWVRSTPYEWMEKIEDIIRKYGEKVFITILQNLLEKIFKIKI